METLRTPLVSARPWFPPAPGFRPWFPPLVSAHEPGRHVDPPHLIPACGRRPGRVDLCHADSLQAECGARGVERDRVRARPAEAVQDVAPRFLGGSAVQCEEPKEVPWNTGPKRIFLETCEREGDRFTKGANSPCSVPLLKAQIPEGVNYTIVEVPASSEGMAPMPILPAPPCEP